MLIFANICQYLSVRKNSDWDFFLREGGREGRRGEVRSSFFFAADNQSNHPIPYSISPHSLKCFITTSCMSWPGTFFNPLRYRVLESRLKEPMPPMSSLSLANFCRPKKSHPRSSEACEGICIRNRGSSTLWKSRGKNSGPFASRLGVQPVSRSITQQVSAGLDNFF